MNRYAVNRGVAHAIKNFRRRLDERKQGCQHGPTIHKAYCKKWRRNGLARAGPLMICLHAPVKNLSLHNPRGREIDVTPDVLRWIIIPLLLHLELDPSFVKPFRCVRGQP